ncbi:MAG TPA: hypothetical protein V6C57_19905 [Coleofasciculaceae cyanobacterium]
MWGGTVVDLTALKAIVTTTDDDGWVLRVKNVATYQLDAGSSDPDAIAPDSGVGRWLPTSTSTPGGSSGAEVLTSNRTYYASATGDDANDGLTSGAPVTFTKARSLAYGLFLNGYTVTIQLADGTYTLTAPLVLRSPVGGKLVIQGNTATPANVILNQSTAATDCIQCDRASNVNLKAFKINNASGGNGLYCDRAQIEIESVVFGNAGYHIALKDSTLDTLGYSITNQADYHLDTTNSAFNAANQTISIAGSLTFGGLFMDIKDLSRVDLTNVTFSGAGSGSSTLAKQYVVSGNSIIRTTSDIPGHIAGTSSTGGRIF